MRTAVSSCGRNYQPNFNYGLYHLHRSRWRENHHSQRQAHRAGKSHHPLHSRRRHRSGHLGIQRACDGCRSGHGKALTAANGKSRGSRFSPAKKVSKTVFNNWLLDDTVDAFREFLVGIKGSLTTPVGGGIRSLNVALRQMLDLYVCLRPVQWFTGVPSPVKHPEKSGHGHLPRKHRGHLRRASNTPAGTPEVAEEVLRLYRQGIS